MEDTFSNQIHTHEAKTSLNHSESNGGKTDTEKDFKTSIPFYSKPPQTSDDIVQYERLEPESEDDVKSYQYQNWPTYDEYGDSIESRVGLNYSNRNDTGKFFTAPYSQEVNNPKMSTVDMTFRPPSASSLQFNYNYPQPVVHSNRQRSTASCATSTMTQPNAGGAQSQGYVGHDFPLNMWHPNAPYGSGSFYPPYGHNRQTNYSGGYSHDQLSTSGREARNLAEKNRRDRINGYIQELSTMVPHVAESPRRVDRSAVLRFATHGLRLQYAFRDTLNQSRPHFTDLLMKLLDSFFITLTCHGQIILISSSIEHHLGHCQADLYGQNILRITHPEDHEMIKQQLIPCDLESLFFIEPSESSEQPNERTQSEEDMIDKKLKEDKRSFIVRLARAGPRSEPTAYEVVKLDGCFRRSEAACSSPSGLPLTRRAQRQDDAIPLHTINGNDIVLVAIARIIRPPKIINKIIEANSLEYKTRHLIDGRIIDCDQRIGVVAGYMTDEVKNLSPFTFMHQDDVRWVIVALRQMYNCNSSYGESTYRLLTRNGYFIYLQSKGYLEIDKETNTVRSFVCVNTLLDEEEGKRRVLEMKKKFSIIINTKIPSSSSSMDVPASENPQQLVEAVLCLIQNLQKTSSDDEEVDGAISQFNNSVLNSSEQSLPSRSASACTMRSSKTPPLALLPPEESSVKTSISKSVNVVNVTAAKNLRGNIAQSPRYPKSPSTTVDIEDTLHSDHPTESLNCTCLYQNDGKLCEECENSRNRVTKLKRSTSCSESEDVKTSKRRLKSTEIQHVIISSLDQLGRSLQQQQNAAIELRDQSDKFEVPNSKNRIQAIMEECQIQNEMFVNITSEIQSQGIDTLTSVETDPEIADNLDSI